jgi:hypothetical protein
VTSREERGRVDLRFEQQAVFPSANASKRLRLASPSYGAATKRNRDEQRQISLQSTEEKRLLLLLLLDFEVTQARLRTEDGAESDGNGRDDATVPARRVPVLVGVEGRDGDEGEVDCGKRRVRRTKRKGGESGRGEGRKRTESDDSGRGVGVLLGESATLLLDLGRLTLELLGLSEQRN